jgi:N-acetyl-alpha-D-muramate 1-phosphate uridylyltransferase
MAPLTDAMPKPMAPYRGSTLIAEGIRALTDRLEFIHITVGYKGAELAEHVIGLDVATVFNTEGHSNSWWIHHTLIAALDEPIYVLTCDNIVDLDFERLEKDYVASGSPACMLVPVQPVAELEGDFILRDGSTVTAVGRDLDSDIYCSGIQILNPKKVTELTEDRGSFYDIWEQLILEGELHVSSVYPDRWIAVDTWEQLKQANVTPPAAESESGG